MLSLVLYLEEGRCLFVLGEQLMIHSNQLAQQSAQIYRLVLLVAEVLIEEGTVLALSGFLVKRGMIPHGSATLDKEEKMVLSSGALVATSCSWGLFSWLGWTGGHRHLFGRFWSSLIYQFAVTTTKDIISRDIEEY